MADSGSAADHGGEAPPSLGVEEATAGAAQPATAAVGEAVANISMPATAAVGEAVASAPISATAAPHGRVVHRHHLVVRVTHWVNALALVVM